MKLKTMTLFIFLGSLVTGPVLAAGSGQAIQNHFDRKGDRIEHRLDNRANIASANGHDKRASHLERKGDRINNHLDRRGTRLQDRFDRRH